MVNIFQDPTKAVPRKDAMIERVDFEQSEIAGRKDHIPQPQPSSGMTVSHIPNADGKS